ncbi:MAG: IclR family transcriptional regulator [Burkholderiales bacterium]|nr:IclR family transcriptional regulator [Burkholderiales bacterium]
MAQRTSTSQRNIRSPSGTQSIQRAARLLRELAARNRQGMRLIDVAHSSGLQRPTVHRMLKCLTAENLVSQDPKSRRYFLGPLVFELGITAGPRFNIRDVCTDALDRIAADTGDTAFLIIRSGDDALCVDRREGAFPIKTFTVDVGVRRPLGVGAGSLAILTALPDDEIETTVQRVASRLPAYGRLTEAELLHMVKRARKTGYVLNDVRTLSGVTAIGVPILDPNARPIGAISVSAISARMTTARQRELVEILRREIRAIEKQLAR